MEDNKIDKVVGKEDLVDKDKQENQIGKNVSTVKGRRRKSIPSLVFGDDKFREKNPVITTAIRRERKKKKGEEIEIEIKWEYDGLKLNQILEQYPLMGSVFIDYGVGDTSTKTNIARAHRLLRVAISDYKHRIGRELGRYAYIAETPYIPTEKYKYSKINDERIDTMLQFADIVAEFSDKFNGFVDIWVQSLQVARIKHPEEYNKNGNRVTLHQNRTYSGTIFPFMYLRNKEEKVGKGHPRLGIRPCPSILVMPKEWRFEIIRLLYERFGFYSYTVDFSSAHPRAVQSFTEKADFPLFHNSLEKGNFWSDLAQYLLDEDKAFKDIGLSYLRKMLKISCLAILNGGGVGSPEHLEKFCEGKVTKSGKLLMECRNMVGEAVRRLPVTKDFIGVTKKMHFQGQSYLMSRTGLFTGRKQVDCCSAVMSSVEINCLAYLMEFIARQPIEMLPVSLENDGVLVLTSRILGAKEEEWFCEAWKVFLLTCINIEVPLELKHESADFINISVDNEA